MAEVAAGGVDGELGRGWVWVDVLVEVVFVVGGVVVLVALAEIAGPVGWGVDADVGGFGSVADVDAGGVVAAGVAGVVGIVAEAVPGGVACAGVDVVVDADGEVGGRHSEEGGQEGEGLETHFC